jgi:hypothetical protein
MDPNGPRRHGQEVGAHRAKEGASGSLPGIYLSFTVFLPRRLLTQLDGLALDIRVVHGKWITRSGILAAIIEADVRTPADGRAPSTVG